MRQLLRLACAFFVLIAIGCASVQQQGAAIKREESIGAWTLTDDENVTFDVQLSHKGTAVSNWSKGPQGAQGEVGRWEATGNRIDIDYTDGWRDSIIREPSGKYRKESFGPRADRNGPPTNIGQAVRTSGAMTAWIGVFEVPVAETRRGNSFYVAIQSSHTAWKSIDDLRVGSWWIAGEALRIRWANGWLDELKPVNGGIQVRSWKPGTTLDGAGNPVDAPTNTGGARRVD